MCTSYLCYPTCNYIDGIALEVSTYTYILLLHVNLRTSFCSWIPVSS